MLDNPYSWKANVGAWESTMHRINVIICTRQAVLSGLKVTTLPPRYLWLDTALLNHARFLVYNWNGAWNHGTDESIALFGVGCTLNRSDYKTLAQQCLAAGIMTAIDSQGSTNEQSTAYAQFNYSLWGRAVDVLRACGADPGTTITTRRALMAKWLALATNSMGNLHQIGDSEVVRTAPIAGTPLEYAGSLGATGIAPAQRVGLYSAGYVLGRSSWARRSHVAHVRRSWSGHRDRRRPSRLSSRRCGTCRRTRRRGPTGESRSVRLGDSGAVAGPGQALLVR